MSRHLNRVTLIGVIGSVEPQLHMSAGQTAVCKFTLGTIERWKDRSGDRDHTDWHNIVVVGKQAGALFPILGPSKRLYVEGKLQNRSWTSGNIERYISEVRADRVILLGHDKDLDKIEGEE